MSAEALVAVVIALVVIALVIKFWKFVLGVLLAGVLLAAVLYVSGQVDWPPDSDSPGGTSSGGSGMPELVMRSEHAPHMDGRYVGVDPATGYQQWESVPYHKVTGTVANVGAGVSHDTKALVVFCSRTGMVIYRSEVPVGDLMPGQSRAFEHVGPHSPQLQHVKVHAHSHEVGVQVAKTRCP